jgi:Leucine-rich repeat (LRR) protein
MNGKILFQISVIIAVSAISISGQCETTHSAISVTTTEASDSTTYINIDNKDIVMIKTALLNTPSQSGVDNTLVLKIYPKNGCAIPNTNYGKGARIPYPVNPFILNKPAGNILLGYHEDVSTCNEAPKIYYTYQFDDEYHIAKIEEEEYDGGILYAIMEDIINLKIKLPTSIIRFLVPPIIADLSQPPESDLLKDDNLYDQVLVPWIVPTKGVAYLPGGIEEGGFVEVYIPIKFENFGKYKIQIYLKLLVVTSTLTNNYMYVSKEFEYSVDVNRDATLPDSKKVIFPDSNLEAAIRAAINKPDGAIYALDLKGISDFGANESSIEDITGLEYCTNLQNLYLENNQITDVSPLSGLTGLQQLVLKGNRITDISPLSRLTNLETLDLRVNQVTDISPLSGLANLQELGLGSNQIIDLSSLSSLSNLKLLGLNNNSITDLSPLSGLTNLRSINLGGNNQITDLSPLSGLTNLKNLGLSYNQIIDLSPLFGLTSLQTLALEGNQITDVSPLSSLTSLKWLYLGNNQITDVSPLSGLTSLQTLALERNQITDASPLSGLSSLNTLNLEDNQITDFSSLLGLTCEIIK